MESLSFALTNSIRFLVGDVIKSLLYYQINFNINMESQNNGWNNKKALWIPEELHKDIKIFAIQNSLTIEQASQMLIKLGMVTYSEEKANDTV